VLLLLTFENETGVVGKALDRAPEARLVSPQSQLDPELLLL